MTPIFIFCAPRTGSTLLQRLLASHSEISTTPEPWVLLPFLTSTYPEVALTNYSHLTSAKAIQNFKDNLPLNRYDELLKEFVLSLYQSAAINGEDFFIDKTPRYYYIIDEIVAMFPRAKFIFLCRDPVQSFSSILTTWNNNQFFKLYRSHDDLFLAPKLLASAIQKHATKSIIVNYEDLVLDNQKTCEALFDYIGVRMPQKMIFDTKDKSVLSEQMGDSHGQLKYQSVSQTPLQQWKLVINNPVRKWYLKRYIKFLGDDVAQTFGYSREQLMVDIEKQQSQIGLSMVFDFLGIAVQSLVYKFKLNLFFSKKYRKNNIGFYE